MPVIATAVALVTNHPGQSMAQHYRMSFYRAEEVRKELTMMLVRENLYPASNLEWTVRREPFMGGVQIKADLFVIKTPYPFPSRPKERH